jgi:phosphatidylinositol glycan class W
MFGESYTERKIDFVTGHTGSNIWDITQVTLVAPVCRISLTLSRISQTNR